MVWATIRCLCSSRARELGAPAVRENSVPRPCERNAPFPVGGQRASREPCPFNSGQTGNSNGPGGGADPWMRTTAGNAGGAAPAGRPPATSASHTRTAPVPLDFSATATTDQGASAHWTTRTLTQTGANSLVGALNWGTGPPPEDRRGPS
jgi:hypothetical protein